MNQIIICKNCGHSWEDNTVPPIQCSKCDTIETHPLQDSRKTYQLKVIAKAIGGTIDGRGFPEFITVKDKDGYFLVFGYANATFSCDIYTCEASYELGSKSNSLDAGTNELCQNIGWAVLRVTGGAV